MTDLHVGDCVIFYPPDEWNRVQGVVSAINGLQITVRRDDKDAITYVTIPEGDVLEVLESS